MYSDIITPKSFPDQLQDVAYDPFDVMPKDLPPHPHLFVTPAQVAVTQGLIESGTWVKAAFELLLTNCRKTVDLPDSFPTPPRAGLAHEAAMHAERNALAWTLTDSAEFRERAVTTARWLAQMHADGHIPIGCGRNNWIEGSRVGLHLARAFDILQSGELEPTDEAALQGFLRAMQEANDNSGHLYCGNHATWALASRMSIASALDDRQGLHDTLYGCRRGNEWRYGLIHQLRHDVLSDGLHWERTLGYHYYTLMALVELLDGFANLGVDLWHKELPSQWQNDGHDLHRAYGPRGTKCVKAAFDAPFYQAFPDGDCGLLSDSGLANLRGIWIWGVVYNKAYEAYGDEKYAWLLTFMEREHPERKHPGLPMPLQTWGVDLDFARYARAEYPAGHYSLDGDCRFSLAGRHERGCSLFPAHGSAVMRADPADPGAPGAFLFWGPHNAGHQAPAALHLDLHGQGGRITDAARTSGYDDPNYLTWARTTIAHNTVTIDETPMFPYDFETKSIWECDYWRDRVSDGELLLFQTESGFKVVRACNENVYPGVRLDRTVITTGAFVLDVFRVLSERPHQVDWTMHCAGRPQIPGDAEAMDLGHGRGYCHLREPRRLSVGGRLTEVKWERRAGTTLALLAPPVDGEVIVAGDYMPAEPKDLGERPPAEPRHCVIVRAQATNCVFVSLWQFGSRAESRLDLRETPADDEIVLATEADGAKLVWRVPFARRSVTAVRS